MNCLCMELDKAIMQGCVPSDLYKKQCTPSMVDVSTTVKRETVNVLPSDG